MLMLVVSALMNFCGKRLVAMSQNNQWQPKQYMQLLQYDLGRNLGIHSLDRIASLNVIKVYLIFFGCSISIMVQKKGQVTVIVT